MPPLSPSVLSMDWPDVTLDISLSRLGLSPCLPSVNKGIDICLSVWSDLTMVLLSGRLGTAGSGVWTLISSLSVPFAAVETVSEEY